MKQTKKETFFNVSNHNNNNKNKTFLGTSLRYHLFLLSIAKLLQK